MSSSENDPLLLACLGLAGGMALFIFGFRVRKRYKVIEHTPTSKVRSVAVGLVELQGVAEIETAPMLSPFAQTECVYYSYKVEERRKSGKNTRWVTVASGQSSSPFRVKDDTGSLLILPSGATCSFAVDQNYRMQLFSSASEDTFKAGLERIGFNYQGLFGDKPLRCSETYIQPGDQLFVLGTATRRKGTIDSERNQDNLYIAKGDNSYFILADHSEKDMLSSLYWQMYLMIYGGPILTVLCLYYLLNRFGV